MTRKDLSQTDKNDEKLQKDIQILRSALKELTLLPQGIYADLDKYISQLGQDLEDVRKTSTIPAQIHRIQKALAKHLIVRQNRQMVIENHINKSLTNLLHHLTVPPECQTALSSLEKILENQLENETLLQVIEGLTGLIADSSQTEQAQYQDFFQVLTVQLQDFDHYLAYMKQQQNTTAVDLHMLQLQIQSQITHIKTSKNSVPDGQKQLEQIENRVREYQMRQEKREKEQGQQLSILQDLLAKSEILADRLKNLMSAQHFKTNHDVLTGLANRFSYEDRILEAINRSNRNHHDLCLVMLNIDHFSHINELHGHLAGDRLLKKLARLFKQSIRSVDFLARYEEDKFLIILENTSRKFAVSMMEKLRKQVADSRFYAGNNLLEVTISIGIATFELEDTPQRMFDRVAKRLQEGRAAG